MAWTAPITHATGDVLPASDWNTYVRDNTKYLHGDGGAVDLSAGAAAYTFANTVNFSTSAIGTGLARIFATAGGALQIFTTTGANPNFQVDTNGVLHWGPGGATAVDTNLYRLSANNLQTDGSFFAGNSIVADAASGGNRLYVGGALDAYFARQAASILALNTKITEGAAQANVTVPVTWTPGLSSGLFQKFSVTAGGANTLTMAAPSNNPVGSTTAFLVLRVANTGGGTVTLSWNAAYTALGVTTLPANVGNGQTSTMLFIFDPNAGKWCLLAVN
jgi:hypothetical protein